MHTLPTESGALAQRKSSGGKPVRVRALARAASAEQPFRTLVVSNEPCA